MEDGNMPKAHLFTLRVYCEDTDFSGRVYHAGYVRFFERARTEMLREKGVEQGVLGTRGEALFFVVHRMEIDFLRPAYMDARLQITTISPPQRVRARYILQQFIHPLSGKDTGPTKGKPLLLAAAKVTLAAVDARGRPVRWPAPA